MTKSNVLLVVDPGVEAPRASARAIERARQLGGALIALAVLDPAATSRVAASLTNTGFVGERVCDDVIEALENDHRGLAEDQLRRIAEEAGRAGVACETLVEEGDLGELCRKLVAAKGVGVAFFTAERRSRVSRFLSRSAPAKVPSLSGCEVEVIEI